MNLYTRAALTGTATGARTFTGLAAVTLTAPAAATRQPDRVLSSRWAKVLVPLAAGQELVMDKLPQTPSRLAALGLGMRLVSAAGCGLALQRRHDAPVAPAHGDVPQPPSVWAVPPVATAGTAVLCAAGASWAGARWREHAEHWFGRDWVGAAVEDAVAVGAAVLGTRR